MYRLPGLRFLATTHRAAVRSATYQFIAVRHEEHRAFLSTVVPEGRRLGELIRGGLLPHDVHVATGCVGAIPYFSNARTLDIHGLTDAHVARHGDVSPHRRMAHDRRATVSYAASRGVDLWAGDDVHLIGTLTSLHFLESVREAALRGGTLHVAEFAPGEFVMAILPGGITGAARRMPALHFRPAADAAFARALMARSLATWRDSLQHIARTPASWSAAALLQFDGRFIRARAVLAALGVSAPPDLDLWRQIARAAGADSLQRRTLLERARALARRQGDAALEMRIAESLGRLAARRP